MIRKKCVVSSFAVISSFWRDSHFERVASFEFRSVSLASGRDGRKSRKKGKLTPWRAAPPLSARSSPLRTPSAGADEHSAIRASFEIGEVEGDEPSIQRFLPLFRAQSTQLRLAYLALRSIRSERASEPRNKSAFSFPPRLCIFFSRSCCALPLISRLSLSLLQLDLHNSIEFLHSSQSRFSRSLLARNSSQRVMHSADACLIDFAPVWKLQPTSCRLPSSPARRISAWYNRTSPQYYPGNPATPFDSRSAQGVLYYPLPARHFSLP